MAVVGIAKNLHLESMFQVQIDGFKDSSFAECSEVSVELDKVEYSPGGQLLPSKQIGGKAKVADVTLKRGVVDDFDMFTWFTICVNLAASAVGSPAVGPASPLYKRNVDIVQLERDGTQKRRWTLFGAFPIKFTGGKWDGKSDTVVVEELVLTYDYPDMLTI